MSAKKIWAIVISLVVVVGLVGFLVFQINNSTKADEITVTEAEKILNTSFDAMATTDASKEIASNNYIKVNEISYGSEKDIIAKCTVTSMDVHAVLSPHYNEFMSSEVTKANGTMYKSALDFKLEFQKSIVALLKNSPTSTNECEIIIYDTDDGLIPYATDQVLDIVFGNLKTIEKEVNNITSYIDENGTEQEIISKNVNKGFMQCFELRYNAEKPDTSNSIGRTWNSFKKDFHRNFIEHGRWKTIFQGLWVTLQLTFCALLIGIVLGFLVAFVRCTYLKSAKKGPLLKIFNAICQVYLTVIRGTPAVVQITIIYFVIFMPMGVSKFLSAVICFGVNSGAYVAEIVRGGIMSIDEGQTEAGRSLGFGYMRTMYHIVFPQAFKAVLPSLANEFVVLLKETSIAFYIGLGDIMYSVNAIRAATYTPFMPLIAAALIYLVLVLVLSKLVSLLERRLRNNER